jgi:hypothetical protein
MASTGSFITLGLMANSMVCFRPQAQISFSDFQDTF